MWKDAPIEETSDEPVLLLLDMPGGVSSLFVARHGDSTVYYIQTGGAIVRGNGNPRIDAAAAALLREAHHSKHAMTPSPAFPLPAGGNVRFYVRTPARAYLAEAPLDDLLNGRSALAALFAAAMEVWIPLSGR